MDIFEDSKDRVANYNKSAEVMGQKVPKKVLKKVKIASKKCKSCWGSGLISWAPVGIAYTRNYYCKCVKEVEIETNE